MAEGEKEKIWVKPVLVGAGVAVLWIPVMGGGLSTAFLAGVAATGVAHLVLSRTGGRKAAPEPESKPAPGPAPTASAASPAPAPVSAVTETPEPADVIPAADPLVKPSKALPGEAELAARKGTWTYKPGAA